MLKYLDSLLCKIGLHKWKYTTTYSEEHDFGFTITDVARCVVCQKTYSRTEKHLDSF